MSRSGANLALLLLGGFRTLVDEAIVRLAKCGHPDVRPAHEFAMRAIASGADDASKLGRKLSISKQAAAKTIELLQERKYVLRRDDPQDARRKCLVLTKRGEDMLKQGEAIFDDLRNQWKKQIGSKQLETLETLLTKLVSSSTEHLDTAAWLAKSQGDAD